MVSERRTEMYSVGATEEINSTVRTKERMIRRLGQSRSYISAIKMSILATKSPVTWPPKWLYLLSVGSSYFIK